MITRIINAFLLGMAFVLIVDSLIFIGFKINFFDLYGIKEYFNIIFIDNQNFYIILPLCLVVGYLLIYSGYSKFFIRTYIVVVLLSAFSIYEPVGKELGKFFFMKENMRFKVGSTAFNADLLYKGRVYTYLYRKDISKVVKLKKEEVKVLTTF